MLRNSKLVAFIATSKPEDAKNFYQKILGLELLIDDDFATVFDANGVIVRIQKVAEHTPPAYTAIGWEVADVQATLTELWEKGVRCERYEALNQNEMGVWSAPGGAQIAWIKDPDGNTLSLTQMQ